MERALVDRAVAEKAERDPIFAAVFCRESHPRGERDVRGDDRVPAVHVALLVEVMHRAAETARAARRLAKKFRHAGIRTRAAGERVCVIAIGGDQVIIRPGGRDRARDDRFLSDVKMAKAADLLRLILLARAFFETPDQQHQREHLDFVALLRRLHGRAQATRDKAVAARERCGLGPKLMQTTKTVVKKRSLRSELRKNIQVGVVLY